jgi:hypothetical protein
MVKIISCKSLELKEITKGYPGLTITIGKTLLEASAVTLQRAKHKNGAALHIIGDRNEKRALIWQKKVTSQIERSWKDQIVVTELAATCISILIAIELTNYTVIERSVRKSGFDYWLGNESGETDLFEQKARLEISGIFKGDENQIEARVKQKVKQTNQSDRILLPSYISVVEFIKPKIKFINKK